MHRKVFALGIDGCNSADEVIKIITETFLAPRELLDYVGYIKLNDALHLDDKFRILSFIIENYPTLNIFFDLKLPDTNGTNANILKKYLAYMRFGDIVTVTSTASLRAFGDIRKMLPIGVKIALVSVLTDTPQAECQFRRGASPRISILNDAFNLLAFQEQLALKEPLFDAVVCGPSEVVFLKTNLPGNIQLIVPGIRDSWMEVGQQSADRIGGIKETLDDGADILVLVSQLIKGNPQQDISAFESRTRSIERALLSNTINLIPKDPLQTLINLEGHYQSKKNEDGTFTGPLVAYAGTYKTETGKKNYVGDVYFNLAMVENHPQRLSYFAKIMVEKIIAFEKSWGHKIDCLVGVPEGGNQIAQEVGRLLDIPGLRLEKEVTALKTATAKEEFNLVIRRNAGAVETGWFALIFEDLCNNFSTTQKAIDALDSAGVVVVGIVCLANRSKDYVDKWKGFLPIISGISVPSDQYEQEDPMVADLITAGSLSTDPKKDWVMLKKAME